MTFNSIIGKTEEFLSESLNSKKINKKTFDYFMMFLDDLDNSEKIKVQKGMTMHTCPYCSNRFQEAEGTIVMDKETQKELLCCFGCFEPIRIEEQQREMQEERSREKELEKAENELFQKELEEESEVKK